MRSRVVEAALAIAATAAVVLFVLRPLPWRADALPRYVGPFASMANADRNLNLWILAWTARAATEELRRLFDGNIYFPADNTLAGSETMLAHLPLTAAVWRATRDAGAVLASEMSWGIGGTALAVYALARFAGAAAFAAALAAAAVALEPGRTNPLGAAHGLGAQPQYLGFQYAPLALLAIVAAARGRRRAPAGIAVALALQALACFYLGYYSFLTIPLFGAWLVARERGTGGVAALAAAVLGGALLALPVALPYLAARRAGAVRPPDPVLPWLGSLAGAGPGAAPGWIGPLALLLGAVGVVAAWRRDGGGAAAGREGAHVAAAAWILVAAAVILALGPELRVGDAAIPLPHGWLAAIVPGFGMLRGPIRALSLATLGLSLAGALALSRLGAAWPRALRAAVAVGGVALAVGWLASRRVPIEEGMLGARLPEVYRWLAAQPRSGGVLEIPGAAAEEDLAGLARESRYMVYSTVHWQPLVNGYTAYPPAWGELAKSLARRLPDQDALQVLVNLAPLRLVVVHEGLLAAEDRELWRAQAAAAGLAVEARFGDDVVYGVVLPPSANWRAAVNAGPTGRTLEGTPTAPLAPACRVGGLEVAIPSELRASLAARALPARVGNRGDCTWPGLAVRPEGLVTVTATWLDVPRGSVPPSIRARLPRDLPPGSSAELDALVLTPPLPGRYRLRIDLAQEGEPATIARSEAEVEVVAAPPAPTVVPGDAGAGTRNAPEPTREP